MSANEIVLVDLSSIAHPIWHMSQAEPDPNATSQKIVARVRAIACTHPHAAICCDSGKSFRHEISSAYKANRPESLAPLQHQITLAREQLAADGYPVWAVRGFEADDVIATGVARALEIEDRTVLVVSADKDLLQLVCPRVRQMRPDTGAIFDEAAVVEKFGVRPDQMRDYLTLVGDKSDNVTGAKGIGEVKARELLTKYGTLDQVYVEMAIHGSQFKPAISTSLQEFRQILDQTRSLIALRSDVDLPFEEIAAERTPKEADLFAASFDVEDDMEDAQAPAAAGVTAGPTAGDESAAVVPSAPNGGDSANSTALSIRDTELITAPAEWERGLDPRSMKDARLLAKDMYESRMFSAYGTPQAVLSTVMVGRELGLPAMASLRSVHIIEGKHSLSAALMAALVLRSGLAAYFEPLEFTDLLATFETHRKGARNPVRLTHTIEMAQRAWSKTPDAWTKSGWGRNPGDMLVARAQARLARLVYPDLLAGLYTPEELSEIREAVAA